MAQQNHQQPYQNIVVQEEIKEDINAFWPVFGRETSHGKQTSFWQKDPQDDLDEEEWDMEGTLSRIGRKQKDVKNYYYKLCGDYLCYYVNKEDEQCKGYLKLTKDVVLESKQLKGKNEDYFYLEFSKDSNMRKLYTKEAKVLKEWFSILREKCILTGFKDHYKKIELLGSGSFATVYKVLRIEDEQVFAAKIYHREKLEENKYKDKFVQMMLNEYEALQTVDHECIGCLYEVFQEEDYCAYVMEYVSGGEIYAKLRECKKFTEEQAAQVIYDCTCGLMCLHHHKYVHRDLKLENIMMTGENNWRVKLIDFGFAEKINRDQLLSKSGTPGFLPPELFRMQPYTEKGDVFSLGIILYCMVSGQSPFKGKTYKEVLENNRKCNISYDSYAWSKISEDCKQLVRNMLEPNPHHRYNSKDILKSPWMTQYHQWQGIDDILTMKSFKSQKSIKAGKKTERGYSDEEEDQYSNIDFRASTMMQFRGEDGFKSFYKKSVKSMKSIKSIKSTKQIKTEYSGSSMSIPSSDNSEYRKPNLSQNYGQIQKQEHGTKFIEDLAEKYNVEVSDEHNINISDKINKLKVPQKRFIHYARNKSFM